MSDREELFLYRLRQAEETLAEAEKMLTGGFSSRTIVNRAYYSMFYTILALFLRLRIDVRTSKHAGVIALFDREVVKAGKMETRFSRMLHRMFELRQKADYKELVEIGRDDAVEATGCARELFDAVKELSGKAES